MEKEELISNLIASGALRTQKIIEAFRAIDRKDFVLLEYLDKAYEDYPLLIGHEATISQPSTVAFMLELLQPQKGEKVLDVGSGSGWTTALLAHIVGETGGVTGVEIVLELVEFGRKNLAKYHFKNVKIVQAQKTLGLPDKAPFDKILVSAAAEKLPEELVAQLKIGGRMVISIQSSIWQIDRTNESQVDKKEFPGFAFVPLH